MFDHLVLGDVVDTFFDQASVSLIAPVVIESKKWLAVESGRRVFEVWDVSMIGPIHLGPKVGQEWFGDLDMDLGPASTLPRW